MSFPLALAPVASLGLDDRALDRLPETVTYHIAEGRYPAAQFAVARHGKLWPCSPALAMRASIGNGYRPRATRGGCSTRTPGWLGAAQAPR